jgi:hypothetical protein
MAAIGGEFAFGDYLALAIRASPTLPVLSANCAKKFSDAENDLTLEVNWV